MNLNLDEISKKVKKFSKDRVEDVQKLNEIRILNGQMNDAKRQIKTLYAEIGKKIYEQYKEAPLSGFETEIQSITDKKELIEELKVKKRNVKQVVLCPCCNMEVPAGEKYCSNCGNKMPGADTADDSEIIVEASDVEEMPVEEETGAAEAETVSEEAQTEEVEETGDGPETAEEAGTVSEVAEAGEATGDDSEMSEAEIVSEKTQTEEAKENGDGSETAEEAGTVSEVAEAEETTGADTENAETAKTGDTTETAE